MVWTGWSGETCFVLCKYVRPVYIDCTYWVGWLLGDRSRIGSFQGRTVDGASVGGGDHRRRCEQGVAA